MRKLCDFIFIVRRRKKVSTKTKGTSFPPHYFVSLSQNTCYRTGTQIIFNCLTFDLWESKTMSDETKFFTFCRTLEYLTLKDLTNEVFISLIMLEVHVLLNTESVYACVSKLTEFDNRQFEWSSFKIGSGISVWVCVKCVVQGMEVWRRLKTIRYGRVEVCWWKIPVNWWVDLSYTRYVHGSTF